MQQRFGFRQVEPETAVWNGVPSNSAAPRHEEWSMWVTRSPAQWQTDVAMMKAANINAFAPATTTTPSGFEF